MVTRTVWPASCRRVGAERVDLSWAAVIEVITRDADAGVAGSRPSLTSTEDLHTRFGERRRIWRS